MPIIQCPIPADIYSITPCDPAEIAPLLEHLHADAGAPVGGAAFPRGTVLPDGRLDLCKQSLGPEGCRRVVAALEGNTHVRSLLLGTDGIGDEGASYVADLARGGGVEIIYLGCNRIGPAGAARLAGALTDNSTVTGLWLKRNPIGPEGAAALAAMLRRNRTLRTLDLVNTGIGLEGLALILAALQDGASRVERLYLGGNGFGPEAAPLLRDLLRSSTSIRALLLNVAHYGDDGAQILAEGLRANSTLEELDLASCGIGPVGVAALCEAVREHTALRTLDLGHSPSTRALGAPANRINDKAAEHLAHLLRCDPPLQQLDLRRSRIGPAGRESLAAAMSRNSHLLTLLLDGPQDPRLAAALRRNIATRGAPPEPPADVKLVRSVYRAARSTAQSPPRQRFWSPGSSSQGRRGRQTV